MGALIGKRSESIAEQGGSSTGAEAEMVLAVNPSGLDIEQTVEKKNRGEQEIKSK